MFSGYYRCTRCVWRFSNNIMAERVGAPQKSIEILFYMHDDLKMYCMLETPSKKKRCSRLKKIEIHSQATPPHVRSHYSTLV